MPETREPMLVADHPVLDLLNTVPMVDGRLVDWLETDSDVVEWLRRVGLLTEAKVQARPGLLVLARQVREWVREAVERRKVGEKIDLKQLNGWLKESRSFVEVRTAEEGGLALRRRWEATANVEILGPLVEAAAELLVEGDFGLIQQCEDTECVLWFYDRTKSHHRRWCSAAMCGNRNKVKAFRQRQRKSGSDS